MSSTASWWNSSEREDTVRNLDQMSYMGSKAQAVVFQRIICQMPPHSLYIEPFFGSGQIFFRKRPAVRNVIIDADPAVIAAANERIVAMRRPPALETPLPTTAICGDAISELPKLSIPHDTVIYCDPPYLLSTRTSRHRYKYEMTDDQHAALLALLQEMDCCVLLSGYPSRLYHERLKKWRCISYRIRTRGRTLTECLWCNLPEPGRLHDWQFFGNDFRERVNVKRFAARFLTRLDAMPELKRNFVLDLVHQRQFRQ